MWIAFYFREQNILSARCGLRSNDGKPLNQLDIRTINVAFILYGNVLSHVLTNLWLLYLQSLLFCRALSENLLFVFNSGARPERIDI
jgi:hypothetical protein